jgi:cytochrome c556
MAEIKSTLELVMERTRNLCMSDEDKLEQAAKEFKEAVNRLCLRYLEGQIDVDGFRQQFGNLNGGPSARADAAAEIARRIDPAGNNGPLLRLIKDGLDGDISDFENMLKDFQRRAQAVDAEAVRRIRISLSDKGIGGSAVVPNLDTDKERTARFDEMVKAFEEELAGKIEKLRCSTPNSR